MQPKFTFKSPDNKPASLFDYNEHFHVNLQDNHDPTQEHTDGALPAVRPRWQSHEPSTDKWGKYPPSYPAAWDKQPQPTKTMPRITMPLPRVSLPELPSVTSMVGALVITACCAYTVLMVISLLLKAFPLATR